MIRQSGFVLIVLAAVSAATSPPATEEACPVAGCATAEGEMREVAAPIVDELSLVQRKMIVQRQIGSQDVGKKVNYGQVIMLFSFGAPGTCTKPLFNGAWQTQQNIGLDPAPEEGCFAGARAWNRDRGRFLSCDDGVPQITNVINNWHARVPIVALIKQDQYRPDYFPCTSDATTKAIKLKSGGRAAPITEQPTKDLCLDHYGMHTIRKYLKNVDAAFKAGTVPALFYTMVHFANISYWKYPPYAFAVADQMQYKVVGYATGEGYLQGAGQRTYLLQHVDDKACVLTFQGTSSKSDAMTDANAVNEDFCGQSKCHNGFVSHARRMVRSPQFRDNIRSKLRKCAGVMVVGHSLGGAVAELFASCVNRGPPPKVRPARDNKWEEDWDLFKWEQGEAESLPQLNASDFEDFEKRYK